MDVLTLDIAAIGSVIVCCIAAYLRWQLADVVPGRVAPRVERRREDTAVRHDRPRSPGSLRGHTAPFSTPRPLELPRLGVYVAPTAEAERGGRHAVVRGQLLADRIMSGRFDARREPRRGRKGALDVIVVGANAIGVSAALHFAHAGWRVLLVDRDAAAAPSAPQPAHGERSGRLALLTGHSVCAVAERPDGMLEVQAERAAWYTANVIIASTESWSVPPILDALPPPSASSSRAA
jgi:hypothetical protein